MKKYNYFPNSYNLDKIKELNLDDEFFLTMQEYYKKYFEILLSKIVNFKSIDDYISTIGISIPIINDKNYNFYHKNSYLKSEYVFLRNNIHIENLTKEEINKIKSCIISNEELDTQFLLNTFKKVLYEEGDFSMYGIETDDCILNSRSLVFELAFNQKDFVSTNQIMLVEKLEEMLNKILIDTVKKTLDTEVSLLKYNGIPDIYLTNRSKEDGINFFK